MTAEPAAPGSRGASPKGIARRREILDRAIEVFARRGSDRTSLRAIASEVGVTHAALRHYFGSLEELLVEVYRASQREHGVPMSKDMTPTELMRVSAERNREIPGLVQLYSTLVAAAMEDDRPVARDFVASRFEGLREALAAQVSRDQAAGRLREDVDPREVAALVIAASDGLQSQWLLEPGLDHARVLTLLDRLLAP
ncbi:TetR/AcrR family transcriptional regulator [Microbacterium sp. ET2]|uniref:TetR/AcrR family transcriptional regulator n=1 Tax=Microbacterium albipurpureum TaxID=3050384 RepID=UPI00259C6F59|nr:TetR/AcrR family transcriptional regulator [Microbacterium sp. ET2 (Ac-2212)]WJL96676.1 TetR/AcrR family transcriptional regulator [Microbacterium sp. ET2 (Ac-2212)]